MAAARAQGHHRDAGTGLTLHVTNGDCAAEKIRALGVDGDVLPWRDVLHDGPVPAGLAAEALREVRARFIADAGWGSYDRVLDDFRLRDETLARTAGEVVLWFEHDLYDQLQLVQALDALGDRPDVALAQADDHLTSLPPDALHALGEQRHAVTADERGGARRAWAAFRGGDPRALRALAQPGASALPHLAPALARLLEELPWARDGLSRTERQALAAIDGGAATPADAFAASQRREERIFLGDVSFFRVLDRLIGCRAPLVRRAGAGLALTADGAGVLAGTSDHVALNGVDRWLGGLHLHGAPVWRWDEATRDVRR
jgi:hypothetical protein